MLFSGNDLAIGKPGEVGVVTKTLARRALNGGQGGNVVGMCGPNGEVLTRFADDFDFDHADPELAR